MSGIDDRAVAWALERRQGRHRFEVTEHRGEAPGALPFGLSTLLNEELSPKRMERPSTMNLQELDYLANFEHLVLTLSGRFINLAPASIDDEINQALEAIGKFAEVDRSYVFRFSDTGDRVSNTHEWCAQAIERAMHRIQDAPVEQYALVLERISRGQVVYVANISDLPADASALKQELEFQGIQSMINVPLLCAGKVLGFVGFDSVRAPKTWRDDHIKLLKVVGEIIAGAIERERATAALTRQVAMEKLIARISTGFINVPIADLDKEINKAIGEIGRFTGVDRSYVFQFSTDRRSMDNTHEWCADGIKPQIGRLQGLPLDEFGYSVARMRKGEIFHVPRVADLPAEASREKAEFEQEGIKTLINVPIMARGSMIGFLGFDAVRRHKQWSDDDSRLLGLVGEILANALDRRSAEERLQVSLEEKEVLLREIHHRVKNNLQVVHSLLYLQANAIRDRVEPVALEAFEQSQSRIKAMAVIHDRLYRSSKLHSIDFEDYLKTLTPQLLGSYNTGGQVRIEIRGQEILLGIDEAIPCGLIINELVTNSLKHAFPAGRKGTIEIGLHKTPDGVVELAVADNGVGFPQRQQWRTGKSLGFELVNDLVDQLDGQLTLDQTGGTSVTIRFTPTSSVSYEKKG